jgi:DNA-binding IclR family transcriptional regulator
MSRDVEPPTAPAVDRAVLVLKHIAAAGEGVSLASLSQALAMPKSSTLSICRSLVNGGLLMRSSSGAYGLAIGVVDLARSYLASATITDVFVSEWEQRSRFIDETVVLSVLDGADVVYVACKNGKVGVSFNYRIGMRLPAWCAASGKAILSTMGHDKAARLLPPGPLRMSTGRMAVPRADLMAQLETARATGYAIDDEEVRAGMCCIGAPVFESRSGPALSAVAISMLKGEFESKRAEAVECVLDFSEALSRRLRGG